MSVWKWWCEGDVRVLLIESVVGRSKAKALVGSYRMVIDWIIRRSRILEIVCLKYKCVVLVVISLDFDYFRIFLTVYLRRLVESTLPLKLDFVFNSVKCRVCVVVNHCLVTHWYSAMTSLLYLMSIYVSVFLVLNCSPEAFCFLSSILRWNHFLTVILIKKILYFSSIFATSSP